VTKSKRIRWEGHVARLGKKKNSYTVWLEKVKEEDCLEDIGVDKG
jgi:hypothetical protein